MNAAYTSHFLEDLDYWRKTNPRLSERIQKLVTERPFSNISPKKSVRACWLSSGNSALCLISAFHNAADFYPHQRCIAPRLGESCGRVGKAFAEGFPESGETVFTIRLVARRKTVSLERVEKICNGVIKGIGILNSPP